MSADLSLSADLRVSLVLAAFGWAGGRKIPSRGEERGRREKKERRVQRHGKEIERRGPYPHAPDGVQSKKKKQHGERLPPPWRRFS